MCIQSPYYSAKGNYGTCGLFPNKELNSLYEMQINQTFFFNVSIIIKCYENLFLKKKYLNDDDLIFPAECARQQRHVCLAAPVLSNETRFSPETTTFKRRLPNALVYLVF